MIPNINFNYQDKHFQMQAFLSIFWSLCAACYIAAVTFLQIPPENIRVVDTIVGFLLGTIVSTVITYWLGSSLGSKLKDKQEPSKED